MSREAVQFEVDGVTYTLTQFGAKKGQTLLLTCAKIVGPALGKAASSGYGDVQLGGMLEELFDGLDEPTMERICADFSEACLFDANGKTGLPLKAHYDDHFAGRYLQMLQWLRECFKVNYGDFLNGLQGMLGVNLGTPKAAALPLTPGSIG
jgi:hypothetical protein